PPVGAGEISPLALKRATQRTALAMLTPKRLAAALRDMPPSTTAPTTRSRRSSESAIPAASFPRRLSSSRSKPIRESLPRFNSLGDRSSAGVRLASFLLVERDRANDDQSLNQFLIPRTDVEDDKTVIVQPHEQHAANRANQPALAAKQTRPTEN